MPKIEIEVRLSDEDRSLLQAVTTAVSGKAPAGKAKSKPAAEAPEDDPDNFDGDGEGEGEGEGEPEGEEVTREDVQAALRDYAAVSSKADAIKLMEKAGGSAALSKLNEKKFAAVIAAAKAATKKAKAK